MMVVMEVAITLPGYSSTEFQATAKPVPLIGWREPVRHRTSPGFMHYPASAPLLNPEMHRRKPGRLMFD